MVNDFGAKVTATNSEGEIVEAETEGIILDIDPYLFHTNHLAIIGAPQLPYATPWACTD